MTPSAIAPVDKQLEALDLSQDNFVEANGYSEHGHHDHEHDPPHSGHGRLLIDPRSRFSDEFLSFPPPGDIVLQRDFEIPPDCGEKSYVGRGRLIGRHALITGGDSGIGRATAIAYAREGAKVCINYLPEEKLDAQDVAKVLAREGLRLIKIPGDLRNEKFCENLVKEAYQRLGGLDIVVNNAGFVGNRASFNSIVGLPTETFKRVFETNVYAPFFITRAAVRYLPPGSAVIFTCSISEDLPEFRLDYSATKAAVTNMVGNLALDLGRRGIRNFGVSPGITFTPILASVGMPIEVAKQQAQARSPFRRMQQPVEIAPVYVDLADDKLSYANGSIWGSHGGVSGAD